MIFKSTDITDPLDAKEPIDESKTVLNTGKLRELLIGIGVYHGCILGYPHVSFDKNAVLQILDNPETVSTHDMIAHSILSGERLSIIRERTKSTKILDECLLEYHFSPDLNRWRISGCNLFRYDLHPEKFQGIYQCFIDLIEYQCQV